MEYHQALLYVKGLGALVEVATCSPAWPRALSVDSPYIVIDDDKYLIMMINIYVLF